MEGDRVREKGREREPVIYVTHSLIHPPGQMIDGPQNGPAPGPWDIAVQPTQLFQNSQNHFEVPHTASVKVCHGCTGNGFNRCSKCLGRGKVSPVISGWDRVSLMISGKGKVSPMVSGWDKVSRMISGWGRMSHVISGESRNSIYYVVSVI